MENYTINYQNGFTKEFEGSLREAEIEAQEGMTYTQCNVSIEKDGDIMTVSIWYGIKPTEEDYENDNVLEEIGEGFYANWI